MNFKLKLLLVCASTIALSAAQAGAQVVRRAELTTENLNTILRPFTSSFAVEASSAGVLIRFRDQDGQMVETRYRGGVITVPLDDPFPGIECTLSPIRLAGPPSVFYSSGRVTMLLHFVPVDPRQVTINTRWTSGVFPDTPGIMMGFCDVTLAFRLKQVNDSLQADPYAGLQVLAEGSWEIRGDLRRFLDPIRSTLNQQIAAAIRANLLARPMDRSSVWDRVSLLVPASIMQFVNVGSGVVQPRLRNVEFQDTRAIFTLEGRDVPVATPVSENEAGTPGRAIYDKWLSLGGEKGFLGRAFEGTPAPRQPPAPRNNGFYQHFAGGSIYWSADTGAHVVLGAIRDRWAQLGWEQSELGFPTSDEMSCGENRFSRFGRIAIVWKRATGEVFIVRKGAALPAGLDCPDLW